MSAAANFDKKIGQERVYYQIVKWLNDENAILASKLYLIQLAKNKTNVNNYVGFTTLKLDHKKSTKHS